MVLIEAIKLTKIITFQGSVYILGCGKLVIIKIPELLMKTMTKSV